MTSQHQKLVVVLPNSVSPVAICVIPESQDHAYKSPPETPFGGTFPYFTTRSL